MKRCICGTRSRRLCRASPYRHRDASVGAQPGTARQVFAGVEPGNRYLEKGIQKGRRQGIGQGREEERVASVRNLMQNLHMTAEEAMQALNIPQEDRDRIQKALANE